MLAQSANWWTVAIGYASEPLDPLFGNAYESARTGFTDDVTDKFGPLRMDSFHEYGSPAAGKREVSVDHFGSVELPVGLA